MDGGSRAATGGAGAEPDQAEDGGEPRGGTSGDDAGAGRDASNGDAPDDAPDVGAGGLAGAAETVPATITCADEVNDSQWTLVDFPVAFNDEQVLDVAIGFGLVHLRTPQAILTLEPLERTWTRVRRPTWEYSSQMLAVPDGVVESSLFVVQGEPPMATYAVDSCPRSEACVNLVREPYNGPVPIGADSDVLWLYDDGRMESYDWASEAWNAPIPVAGATSALLLGKDLYLLEIRLNTRTLSRLNRDTLMPELVAPPPEVFSDRDPHVTLNDGFAAVEHNGSALYYDAIADTWTALEHVSDGVPVRAGSYIASIGDDGTVTLTDPRSGTAETSGSECAPGFSRVTLRAGSKDGVMLWGDSSDEFAGRGALLLVRD